MAVGPRVPPIMPEAPYAAGAHGRPTAMRLPSPEPAAAFLQPEDAAGRHLLPHMTALDEAVARALGHQDGLAPLFATLARLQDVEGLPPAVRTAVAALLALRLPSAPDAEAVRRAFATSGLFHEATWLARLASTGSAGPLPVPSDLKGALAFLTSALAGWLGTARSDRDVEASIAARAKPAAPRRSTPLRGQLSEPPPEVSGMRLAAEALEEADRAVARILLHQAASLDGERDPSAAARAPLTFELPFVARDGTAVAQFRVEADDHRPLSGTDQPGRTWRVEFAVALRGIGPVTARVGLMPGRRIVVGLWCEDPVGVPRLEAEIAGLRRALEAGGLEVAGIDLHLGRPPVARDGAAGEPPHRLDVAL